MHLTGQQNWTILIKAVYDHCLVIIITYTVTNELFIELRGRVS